MSVAPHVKSAALRILFVVTALLGLLAYHKLPNTIFRALVMIAVSTIIAWLWYILHSERPLAERRRLMAVPPKLSDLGKGVIVALLAFPWVAICGLAIRYRILSDSLTTIVIIAAPAGAFLLTGTILVVRAYYRAIRGS